MLNVHRMRVLREVARCGSIAGAADALALTPSAASQHVSMLERETGVALLQRGPCSIRLTEAGRVLAAHADDVLVRLASAEASLHAVTGQAAGTLAVASFAAAGPALLAPALAELRRRHAAIAVSHVEAEPSAALAMVAGGEVDLALVHRYGDADDPPAGVRLAPLGEDPVLVALPRGHRLAGAPEVALGELAGEPWIVTDACRAAGVEPPVAVRTGDHALACALVTAGAGVALVPRLAVRGRADGLALRPLAGRSLARHIFAAHRDDGPLVAALLTALGAP